MGDGTRQSGCRRRWGSLLATTLGMLLASAVISASADAKNLSYTFDSSAQGWMSFNTDCQDPPSSPDWHASGGNPGGYVGDSDDETIYGDGEQCFWFLAGPVATTGNLLGNYGGTVSFDVKSPNTVTDLNIPAEAFFSDAEGNELIGESAAPPPKGVWQHYSFQIRETAPTAWTFIDSSGNNRPATQADFFEVLGDVAATGVLGDLLNGQSYYETQFDNIALTDSPDPLDSDGDGIFNEADACPGVSGLVSNNGCPPPPDQDDDGVPDATDACPAVAGPSTNHGCPIDPDGDGLIGTADHCPTVAGAASNDGCPVSAECKDAKAKLKKAKAKLKKLINQDAPAAKIKKAKARVRKAKGAVKKAC
jgi:hypothetical protein